VPAGEAWTCGSAARVRTRGTGWRRRRRCRRWQRCEKHTLALATSQKLMPEKWDGICGALSYLVMVVVAARTRGERWSCHGSLSFGCRWRLVGGAQGRRGGVREAARAARAGGGALLSAEWSWCWLSAARFSSGTTAACSAWAALRSAADAASRVGGLAPREAGRLLPRLLEEARSCLLLLLPRPRPCPCARVAAEMGGPRGGLRKREGTSERRAGERVV
jgi:hypothetical protein